MLHCYKKAFHSCRWPKCECGTVALAAVGPPPAPKPPDLQGDNGTSSDDRMMEDPIPTIGLSEPTPSVGGDDMQLA